MLYKLTFFLSLLHFAKITAALHHEFLDIPIFSMSEYFSGNDDIKRQYESQFNETLHSLGLCFLTDDTIDFSDFTQLMIKAKRFFRHSTEYKKQYEAVTYAGDGYIPPQDKPVITLTADEEVSPELLEFYSINYFAHETLDGLNFPPDLNDSQALSLWTKTHISFRKMLSQVNNIASKSLGLSRNYFGDMYANEPRFLTRMVHYWELNDEVFNALNNNQFRNTNHEDGSAWTILWVDEVPGLQVFHDGIWQDVAYVPDSFILIVGKFNHIITNGHWKPANHRIIAQQPQRLSIPFFALPNAMIEPVPECDVCNKEEFKFEREHSTEYLKKTFAKSKKPGIEESTCKSEETEANCKSAKVENTI